MVSEMLHSARAKKTAPTDRPGLPGRTPWGTCGNPQEKPTFLLQPSLLKTLHRPTRGLTSAHEGVAWGVSQGRA